MKKEYKIGEISKIYNLSTDALRLYERKGLLNPKRASNGYRLYTLDDIWKLNIINDMRKLGFTIAQIKSYLENRSLELSLDLIKSEINFIDKEIAPLLKQQRYLKKRLQSLREISNMDDYNQVKIKSIEKRKIIFIEGNFETDEEIDLAFRKLESRDDSRLMLFASKDMGVMITRSGVRRGDFSDYQNVFFLLDEDEEEFDAIIPGGEYATIYYKGDYKNGDIYYKKLLEEIPKLGYKIKYPVLELYRLDIHSTSITDEYVTEIQVRIDEL